MPEIKRKERPSEPEPKDGDEVPFVFGPSLFGDSDDDDVEFVERDGRFWPLPRRLTDD